MEATLIVVVAVGVGASSSLQLNAIAWYVPESALPSQLFPKFKISTVFLQALSLNAQT
jgi:hypothetical protein